MCIGQRQQELNRFGVLHSCPIIGSVHGVSYRQFVSERKRVRPFTRDPRIHRKTVKDIVIYSVLSLFILYYIFILHCKINFWKTISWRYSLPIW